MYVREETSGLFALRQGRFRSRLLAGKPEHPHDVCALARSRAELRDMCAKHWPDVDYGEDA